MPTETLPPARAARQIGIPPNTLRAWCKTYGEFLSPGATPGQGEERRLTPGDVETLKAVSQLRANDIPPEDIIARLRENPSVATTALPPSPESSTIDSASVSATTTALAPATIDSGTLGFSRQTLETVVGDHDRRLAALEGQRTIVWVAVGAFAAGAVVVAVIVWLLSMVR
jgi:transposase-like protein